jgi:hypothetical protein
MPGIEYSIRERGVPYTPGTGKQTLMNVKNELTDYITSEMQPSWCSHLILPRKLRAMGTLHQTLPAAT